MERIFLSSSFEETDAELASLVRRVIEAHDIVVVTGGVLGGDMLTSGVQKRIGAADGMVSIWTRRDSVAGEQFRTSNWLIEEVTFARAKEKPVVVLVETGVDTRGMGQAHERIELDRENPANALLRLSETVGTWRRTSGNTVKVRLTPLEVARRAASPQADYHCRYRLHDGPTVGPWHPTEIHRDVGGVFTYLMGVTTSQWYEIWLTVGAEEFLAPASPQDCAAALERVES